MTSLPVRMMEGGFSFFFLLITLLFVLDQLMRHEIFVFILQNLMK